jgi:hypothetical protein
MVELFVGWVEECSPRVAEIGALRFEYGFCISRAAAAAASRFKAKLSMSGMRIHFLRGMSVGERQTHSIEYQAYTSTYPFRKSMPCYLPLPSPAVSVWFESEAVGHHHSGAEIVLADSCIESLSFL